MPRENINEPFPRPLSEEDMQKLSILSDDFNDCEVERLIERLSDSDIEIRCLAATRLGRTGDPRALEPLMKAFQDPSERLRGGAALGLGSLGSEEAVPVLIEHMQNDPSGVIRRNCGAALQMIGSKEATDALVAARTNSEPTVRITSAWILVHKDIPGAEGLLPEMLNDPSSRVRGAVVDAMVMFHQKKAAEPLTRLLDDPDWQVRHRVCDQLTFHLGIGDKRIVDAIAKLLAEPESAEHDKSVAESLEQLEEARKLGEEFDENVFCELDLHSMSELQHRAEWLAVMNDPLYEMDTESS